MFQQWFNDFKILKFCNETFWRKVFAPSYFLLVKKIWTKIKQVLKSKPELLEEWTGEKNHLHETKQNPEPSIKINFDWDMSEMSGHSNPPTPSAGVPAATPTRSQEDERSLRECEDYVQRHRIQQVSFQAQVTLVPALVNYLQIKVTLITNRL